MVGGVDLHQFRPGFGIAATDSIIAIPGSARFERLRHSDRVGQRTGHTRRALPRKTLATQYDSHAQQRVVGSTATGSRVKILLHQANPVLSFYLVRTINTGMTQEGWVPTPFLQVKP